MTNETETLDTLGYAIREGVFDANQLRLMDRALERSGVEKKFGLREFLVRYPALKEGVLTPALMREVNALFTGRPLLIKSIYFDKPPAANWVVSWHQDLTVNLQSRGTAPGFTHWRTTPQRTVARPPLTLLERIVTVRIHLDDCTATNGALQVIPGSHRAGVIDMVRWQRDEYAPVEVCELKRGGVLLMKPLTLHASHRTQDDRPRRVIHLEFTDLPLPPGLAWRESIAPAAPPE